MQDHAKQNELLNRMRDEPDGSIAVRRFFGMSEDQRHELHQIELLRQMGMAVMKSESMVRITADGYRHLGVPVGEYAKQSELLGSMRDSPDGCLLSVLTFGMSPDERRTLHQIELLCDMGLTHMKSDSMTCLTAAGYERLDDESRRKVVKGRAPETVDLLEGEDEEWDAFISHATEDKDEFVRPLSKALERRGLRVWMDESELKVGDRLRRSIDRGLARSRYGIVILSPSFFSKHWTQQELDGLLAREAGGRDLILPVWHKVDSEGVKKYSLTLSDRFATSSTIGVEAVADVLEEVIRPPVDASGDPDGDASAFIGVGPEGASRGDSRAPARPGRSDQALVYKILEHVSRHHRGGQMLINGSEFAGYTGEETMRGVVLCVTNGYIIGKTEYPDDELVSVGGLTAKGQEALETML